MDTVNRIRCNVYCALEAEGHICSPQVIVNGLGKRNDIEPFLAKQIGCLMGSVASQDHKAVQAELIIILLHGLYLVKSVFIRILYGFKRSTGASKDRAALRKNSGKILSLQHAEISVDQTSVAVQKAINFNFFSAVYQTFYHAAHSCV